MSSAQSSKNNKALRISGVLAMVAVGHLVSAWLIGNMKMPEIRPLELTKPLEVKMIHIEKPKPIVPPQPKKEPPKEKPKPKPQPPKEIKPKPVEKPKPQPVVKPVPQKVIQTKTPSPKPQQVAVDVPPAPPSPPAPPAPPSPPAPPAPPSPPAPPAPPSPPAPPAPPSPPAPVKISEGQIKWQRKPYIDQIKLNTLIEKATSDTVHLTFTITTDVKGKIISATMTKSSGVPELDTYAQKALMNAKLKEHKVNGVPTPVTVSMNYTFRKSKKNVS